MAEAFGHLLGEPFLLAGILAIVFAASIVQAGLGMGFGLTAAPLLALIDPQLVPAPTLFLGMFSSGWGAVTEHRGIVWGEVGLGLVGRAAGVAAASMVLASLTDARTFMLVFGLMILAAVLLSVSGRRIAFNRASLLAMTTVSGLMGTITSVGAPPLALIYQDRAPAIARPTLAAFFSLGCGVSLAGLHLAGWAGWYQLALALVMTPVMFVGLETGRRVRDRFDRRYRPALLIIAGIAAVMLIARGIA